VKLSEEGGKGGEGWKEERERDERSDISLSSIKATQLYCHRKKQHYCTTVFFKK